MSQFQQTLAINAEPERVLDFISDIENLPKYLPTTKSAQQEGEERVRVQGEAHHHKYDSDGYLRCDRQARRLEWGADDGHYSGYMQVDPDGDSASTVTVHISFRTGRPGGDQGPSDEEIDEALEKSLQSIRNHLEGVGGKIEPHAAT